MESPQVKKTHKSFDTLRIAKIVWNVGGKSICTESNSISSGKATKAYRKVQKAAGGGCIHLGSNLIENKLSELHQEEVPLAVVSITTTEDGNERSLHSNLLKEKMGNYNFEQVRYSTLDLGNKKAVTKSGRPMKGKLRTSVYIHRDILRDFQQGEQGLHNQLISAGLKSGKDSVFPASSTLGQVTYGAIGCYIRHPDYGIIALVDVHYPYGGGEMLSNMQAVASEITREMYRTVSTSNFLEYYIHAPVRKGLKINYVIFSGDMHSQLVDDGHNILRRQDLAPLLQEGNYAQISKYDEVSNALEGFPFSRDAIPQMMEGIENKGPNFPPNSGIRYSQSCLYKGESGSYNRDCYVDKDNEIMYRERVLYASTSNSQKGSIDCSHYSLILNETITESGSAAVSSVIDIKRTA